MKQLFSEGEIVIKLVTVYSKFKISNFLYSNIFQSPKGLEQSFAREDFY